MPEMTVGELQCLLDQYPDDAIVRVMYQPSYPIVDQFHGVVRKSEYTDHEEMEPTVEGADPEDSRTTFKNDHVYLLASGSHPSRHGDSECYGNKAAWEAAHQQW